MKRDMNIVRDLLLFYESDGVTKYPTADSATIDEHLMLLKEAGFIRATGDKEGALLFPPDDRTVPLNDVEIYLFPLTWAGHEFLAAARDQKLWNKALSIVGSVSVETLKAYLKKLAHEKLGIGE